MNEAFVREGCHVSVGSCDLPVMLIPAAYNPRNRRWRQEDQGLQASLGYIVTVRLPELIWWGEG